MDSDLTKDEKAALLALRGLLAGLDGDSPVVACVAALIHAIESRRVIYLLATMTSFNTVVEAYRKANEVQLEWMPIGTLNNDRVADEYAYCYRKNLQYSALGNVALEQTIYELNKIRRYDCVSREAAKQKCQEWSEQ